MRYSLSISALRLKHKKKSEAFASLFSLGRDDKTRTCDLAPPRRVRYQLRYIPFLTFVGAKV